MEKYSQNLVHLANKSFSDSLVDGFKLFAQTYGKIILPLALFQVLLITLDVLLLTELKWYVNSLELNITDLLVGTSLLTESELNTLTTYLIMNLAIIFLQNLIGAIIITIAMCSVSNYTYNKYMGEDISFKESFKSAFNKKILLVILIIGIALPISSLLLFIPAIIVFGFFIFLIFTFNIDGIPDPIQEAKRISKGAFFKIIGVFVVNAIFFFVIGLIFNTIISTFLTPDMLLEISSWNNPATRNYGMLILYQILISILEILFAPLFICLLTTVFSTLKARKDLGGQYQRGYHPVREDYRQQFQQPIQEPYNEYIDSAPQSEIQLKNRLYCPYCGQLIKIPKKFCPKCGEAVESFL